MLAALFSEKGISRLGFRHIIVVAFLVYLMQPPGNHYAHMAMQESKSPLRNRVFFFFFNFWIALADLELGDSETPIFLGGWLAALMLRV